MTAALLGFALAATLLILAPGPDTMLVVGNSLRGGRRMGLCTSAGTVTGLLIWAGAAALGLSSLVAARRVRYDILRANGATYLIWLGATSLWPRHHSRPNRLSLDTGPTSNRVPAGGLRRAYLKPVISDVCNPKIGAFRIQRRLERLTGLVLIGFGIRLATEAR